MTAGNINSASLSLSSLFTLMTVCGIGLALTTYAPELLCMLFPFCIPAVLRAIYWQELCAAHQRQLTLTEWLLGFAGSCGVFILSAVVITATFFLTLMPLLLTTDRYAHDGQSLGALMVAAAIAAVVVVCSFVLVDLWLFPWKFAWKHRLPTWWECTRCVVETVSRAAFTEGFSPLFVCAIILMAGLNDSDRGTRWADAATSLAPLCILLLQVILVAASYVVLRYAYYSALFRGCAGAVVAALYVCVMFVTDSPIRNDTPGVFVAGGAMVIWLLIWLPGFQFVDLKRPPRTPAAE